MEAMGWYIEAFQNQYLHEWAYYSKAKAKEIK
jgi:hypothetical protein